MAWGLEHKNISAFVGVWWWRLGGRGGKGEGEREKVRWW